MPFLKRPAASEGGGTCRRGRRKDTTPSDVAERQVAVAVSQPSPPPPPPNDSFYLFGPEDKIHNKWSVVRYDPRQQQPTARNEGTALECHLQYRRW
ncbi:unnamed protein product [Dibothriocephalus latus]|uniref:Uncharacterized protein n=1 Tax=Dibothriocephalus latus TaxID=60516 RepID=A0A3P7NUF0_DIBLA|nr:unnamed protein product [Dibothriocephalus latus]